MIDNFPIQKQYPIEFNKSHYNQETNSFQQDLVQVSPSIYYGNLNSLSDNIFVNHNFKIIINCLPTHKFLHRVNDSTNKLSLSSDVMILSLDLNFDINEYSEYEKHLLNEFTIHYDKIMKNFINYFVNYNDKLKNHVHELPNNLNINLQLSILTGNLKNCLFKLVRIIKLFKVMNNSIDILVVGEFNENFSKALLISYLMDTYNYNLHGCLTYLNYKVPININSNYYNDLLILENLKKFYQENNDIKLGSCVLFNNKWGKRSRDEDECGRKRLRY